MNLPGIDITSKFGPLVVETIKADRSGLVGQMIPSKISYVAEEDPNFEWQIRIDVRSGTDMPINPYKPDRLPSMYVELAWSESIYKESILP